MIEKISDVTMLLKLVEDYPGIRSAELREKLNVSQRTVERWLKYLRDEKKIVFKGAFKTGGKVIKIGKKFAVLMLDQLGLQVQVALDTVVRK